jgi:hypothetical protein
MTTATFDTLHAAEQLEKVGFSLAQSRGLVEVQKTIISEIVEDKSLIKQPDLEQHLTKIEHDVDFKIGELHLDSQKLDSKVDLGFEKLDKKIDIETSKLDKKMDLGFEKLDKKIDIETNKLDKKMDLGFEKLDKKIDTVNANLGAKIDGVQNEIKYMRWTFGIIIVLLIIPLFKSLFDF